MDEAERLAPIIARLLDPAGLELVGVSWARGRGGGRLRLVVDRPGGVTVDECGQASRTVSQWLDSADPLPGPYTLEVSSPGAERPLDGDAQLAAAVGHRVRLEVATAEKGPAIEPPSQPAGRIFLEGWLVAVGPDALELEVRAGRRRAGERRRIARSQLVAARRLVDL